MAIRYSTPSKAEVQTACVRFRQHLFAELKLRETTIDNYVGVLRRAAPELGIRFTAAAARDYLARLRAASAGYSHLTVTAVGLERYLVFLKAKDWKLPRPAKPPKEEIEPLSEFEVALILWKAPTLRERALLAVLAYAGVRNTELCRMRVRDVDLAGRTLYVKQGKGGQSRAVNVAGECVELLGEYLNERGGAPDDRLFVTVRHGFDLDPQDVRKIVRTAARRAGLDDRRVWPHLFRHSRACALVTNGADLFTIQQQLGHRHLITTMEYLHPQIERARTQYHAFAPRYSAGKKPRLGRRAA